MAVDVSVTTRDGEIIASSVQRPAPPCAIVIFGASGDLTHRKLIPAIFDLFQAGLLSRHSAVMGFSRSQMTDDEFRRTARDGLEHYGSSVSERAWEEFKSCLHYMSGQFDEPASYELLRQRLEKIDAAHGTQAIASSIWPRHPSSSKSSPRSLAIPDSIIAATTR